MSVTERATATHDGEEPLLGCMRRLAGLAERASEPEEVFSALARELNIAAGAEEVHIHHLGAGAGERDLVVVHLPGAGGKLSYLSPRGERAPAVSFTARTARSFLASGQRELTAGLPRLLAGPEPASSALLVPLVLRGEVAAVLVLLGRRDARFDERAVERACALVDQAATVIALLEARAEAGTDPVTGCMNRRAMRRRLREEVRRAERSGGSLSCLLIDLDDFKQINDRHGHQSGDEALRRVSETLMREFRAFDRVARYGGDEFVVILPEADLPSAVTAAERAMGRLRLIRAEGAREGVAASIGVAQWRPSMSVEALLAACDGALLAGKRDGKRRVRAAR